MNSLWIPRGAVRLAYWYINSIHSASSFLFVSFFTFILNSLSHVYVHACDLSLSIADAHIAIAIKQNELVPQPYMQLMCVVCKKKI